MIITNLVEIQEKLPLACSLLLQFIQTTSKRFPRIDHISIKDTFIFISYRDKSTIVVLTDEILRDFLISENVIINIIGGPEGNSWAYVIFSNKKSTPAAAEAGFTNYYDAALIGYQIALGLINTQYNEPSKLKVN